MKRCPCGHAEASDCQPCPFCGGPGCENNFDRSLCACGSMHTHCDNCGMPWDCELDPPPAEPEVPLP